MITRKPASEYKGFKIRSNKVIFSDGEIYGCYNWINLGDSYLLEYRRFFKEKGVFSERKKVESLEEVRDHIEQCPAVTYKLLSLDKKQATKWCDTISDAFIAKKKTVSNSTKTQNTDPKHELHLENGNLWIIRYNKDVEHENKCEKTGKRTS